MVVLETDPVTFPCMALSVARGIFLVSSTITNPEMMITTWQTPGTQVKDDEWAGCTARRGRFQKNIFDDCL